MRLSEAQQEALDALYEVWACGLGTRPKLGRTAALVACGAHYERTFTALAARGLARYYPYAEKGHGAWGITPAGRVMSSERDLGT